MTPTPVQIEAAANAMIDCMFAPHELPLDGELQGKYYETAQAALTAAAEVVEPLLEQCNQAMKPTPAQIEAATDAIAEVWISGLGPEDFARIALTAAAEAEAEHQLDPHIAPLTPHGIALVNATIERCAQVAENAEIGTTAVRVRIKKYLAAAIRALEEQP